MKVKIILMVRQVLNTLCIDLLMEQTWEVTQLVVVTVQFLMAPGSLLANLSVQLERNSIFSQTFWLWILGLKCQLWRA